MANEYDEIIRLIFDDSKAVKPMNDTIKLMDEVGKASKEMSDQVEKDSQDISKSVTKELTKTNKGLDSFAQSMRRSRQELKENVSGFSVFGVSLNSINNQLKNTINNFKLFREGVGITTKLTLTQAKGVVTLSNALGGGRKAIKALTVGFNVLRSAIIATGIGALVVGLTGLVSVLTKTQDGMDFVGRKTAYLGGLFDGLTDKVSSVGKSIINSFKDGTVIEDFGQLLQDQLVNRFTAIGGFFKGFKTLFKDPIKGLKELGGALAQSITGFKSEDIAEFTDDLTGVARESERIKGAFQVIRREQSKLEAQTASTRAEIKRLNQIGEDTTKSFNTRAEAIKQAIALEQNQLDQRIGFAQQELDLIRQKNSLTKSTDADLQKEYDAEVKLANLQAESLELQTTLTNKLNTIDQQRIALMNQRLAQLKAIKQELFDAAAEAELISSEEARKKVLQDQIAALKEQKAVVTDLGNALGTDVSNELNIIDQLILKAAESLGEFNKIATRDLPKSLEPLTKEGPDIEFTYALVPEESDEDPLGGLLDGIDSFEDAMQAAMTRVFGDPTEAKEFIAGVQAAFNSFTSIMNESVNRQIEANEKLIEQKREQRQELEKELDEELSLQEDGLANNVSTKQEEINQLLAEEEKYEKQNLELKKKAQRQQLAIDTVNQAQSLITSSIQIIKGFSNIPVVGLPLGIAAVGTLLAFFAKTKADAFKQTKLYTGAKRIDDHFGFVDRYGDSDLQGGEGYKVVNARTGRDTNVRISGKEMLLKEDTSLRHESFLNQLSKGYYDDLDLSAIVNKHIRYKNEVSERMVNNTVVNNTQVVKQKSGQWVTYTNKKGETEAIYLEIRDDQAYGSRVIIKN